MKTIILLLLLMPCCTYADDILNEKQHEAFCVELKQWDTIDATISRYEKEADENNKKEVVIPPKSEFETTAEFQARTQASKAAAEKQKTERDQAESLEINALIQKTKALAAAVERKQNNLPEIVACVRVTMGAYDADNAKIDTLKPEMCILGGYEGHTAIIKTAFEFPRGLNCPPANARLMREASDKGELYCVVRLQKPKLVMAHESIEVPLSTGDKVSHFIGKLGAGLLMNAVNPDQAEMAINSMPNPTTKSLDAYVIRIDSANSLEYLRFLNGSKVIYGK